MKIGKKTEFTNFGMMATMVTSSVEEEKYYGPWSRGNIRKLFLELSNKIPFSAKTEIAPEKAVSGHRVTVELSITPLEKQISVGGRIVVLLPQFWGGIVQERDPTTFFLWNSPKTYPGYISSHITAEALNKKTEVEGTVTCSGSVHTAIDLVILKNPIEIGETLKIVIGDTCGLPALPIEFSGKYYFAIAIDPDGKNDFYPVRPIPSIEVVGGRAEKFRITVPACHSTKKHLNPKIVPVDSVLNKSKISGKNEIIEESKNDFRRVIVINRNEGVMGISNPSVKGHWVENYNVYFGEIHAHTELSDGIGNIDDAYKFSRDNLGLDFAGMADHFEKFQPTLYHKQECKWEMTMAAAEKFNSPGKFVTLLGYEWGGRPHTNIYYRGDKGPLIPSDDPRTPNLACLYECLKKEKIKLIAIPHHPKFLASADWSVDDPEVQRLVEIYSGWGSSEDGNEFAAICGLKKGLGLGIIAGTDNHIGRPGQGNRTYEGGGLACVLAPSLTRENIFDALFERRCYGTTGARILLDFCLNGAIMGSEISLKEKKQKIAIRTIGEREIESVEILKNGEVACIKKPNTIKVDFSWEDSSNSGNSKTDFYYVRVRQIDGHIAWSSPIWVSRYEMR